MGMIWDRSVNGFDMVGNVPYQNHMNSVDGPYQSSALATLRNCVNAVINWNTQNMLLCNPGKTEVIQFTSRFVRNPVLSQFSFGNTNCGNIELSDKVRDLGVILDKELN